ncbi:MVD [Cordylochernes scorpioides]|uniref:MVD n=1 Tax=Cordylochernes scorpioides TaxID=51811 RepID=A0ABY6KNW5_9ARAC|nr:MVD [Cordylochernes scorpioides]
MNLRKLIRWNTRKGSSNHLNRLVRLSLTHFTKPTPPRTGELDEGGRIEDVDAIITLNFTLSRCGILIEEEDIPEPLSKAQKRCHLCSYKKDQGVLFVLIILSAALVVFCNHKYCLPWLFPKTQGIPKYNTFNFIMRIITAKAPVNIAVIKYWGKRNEDLLLPINDSISVTLSKEHLCAITTVATSKDFKEDKMWLNGVETDINNPRIQNCLKEIRRHNKEENEEVHHKIHICSKNNFPTAAGLASSAAGYACLVYALGNLFQLKTDLSIIARQGSGSACRSIYGGFVQWKSGEKEDGSDSYAVELANESKWPDLRVLILVVSDTKKKISSTIGMATSVATSELLAYRAKQIVPERTKQMKEAIETKDFKTFAELTMKDSNQFHATCFDTYPPIRYLNDISWSVINLVHEINDYYGETKVAYTFDAGPNACLYMLEKDIGNISSLLSHVYQIPHENFKGQKINFTDQIPSSLQAKYHIPDAIKNVISTSVGSGPELISDHLLDNQGNPF